jgi:hypothetical protein
MPTIYYSVSHIATADLADEERLIGIFSSEDVARRAVAELENAPGFSDHRDRFYVNEETVDDHPEWREGFVLEDDAVPGFAASTDFVDEPVVIDDEPNVYRLQHLYTRGVYTSGRHLGYYSSIEAAKRMVAIVQATPGFRITPYGYALLALRLDVVHWTHGFTPARSDAFLLGHAEP